MADTLFVLVGLFIIIMFVVEFCDKKWGKSNSLRLETYSYIISLLFLGQLYLAMTTSQYGTTILTFICLFITFTSTYFENIARIISNE